MATVYVSSLVGTFIVGDGHVVGSKLTPRSVYPPGFIASICGETICGDGHVSLGAPSGQFGTVTVSTSSPQSRTVTGLGSAQLFGTPTVRATITRTVGAVASVAAFGTIAFRVSAPIGGVSTAQQFGVPTAKAGAVSRTVGAVVSAASFGTVSAKSVFVRTVGGVGSAQAFGTPTTKTTVRVTPSGLGSAQSFGVLTVKATVTRTLAGLGSAQAFGSIIAAVPKQVGGVSTAQAFGVPRTKVTVPITGLGSARLFGTPTIPQRLTVPGLGTAQAFGDTIGGLFVGHLWLDELDCIASADVPICGIAICDDPTICGGRSFNETFDCLDSLFPPIVNEFICGQRLVGGVPFQEPADCLDSPLPAICDEITLCGTVVCGGASFISDEPCFIESEPLLVNTFLVGTRLVGGYTYLFPPVTRTIDLQPAGCL